MIKVTCTALAVTMVVGIPQVRAQDLTAWYNNQVAQQNAYFNQMQAGMVQSNLNNPQVMAAYRAGACGPGLSPQQFAYKWAATGGCTVQGMQAYMNNRDQNAARDQASWQGYQQAQMARAQAMQAQQQGFSGNQYQSGMQLGGWRYGYAPNGQVVWYR
ncbi:hypothetical protein OPKNFCMD_5865 [Methylobacterium crusticola]|uniref:Uncharacterized protein n=1 Tax=Methylobacterium crusticola TaxID=1697972 RepID=A0ABQ4R7E8_9HYPH|nr:hypothetical protein [Methylobacterium crusticola]GJD53094.1 hypothetical protein OPKNFCMD_5865 [Methylobacterium crusticola]